MISIFRKFFAPAAVVAKPAPAVPTPSRPAAPPRHTPASEPNTAGGPSPSVEVAHLSLAAIISRFPEELKSFVIAPPESTATISFPVQLIHRQLATGTVKISFASLHRQAPPGVFGPLPPGEKRQVEIPLKEVFRHVNPQTLKRRNDQRSLDAPESEFSLFGNAANPHQIAPTTPENPRRRDSTTLDFQPPARGIAPEPNIPAVAPAKPADLIPPTTMRIVPPPAGMSAPHPSTPLPELAAAAAPVTTTELPNLKLALSALAGAWPEPIRSEISAFNPATTVTLPGSAVSAGLAKGKVVFTWGEICAALEPAPAQPSVHDSQTELLLPLKVVAPAFLSSGKKAQPERKAAVLDDSIPALFSPCQPAPLPIAPAPLPTAPAAAAAAAPEPTSRPAAPVTAKVSGTIGEIFGTPDQHEFTPATIVAGTVKLAGVAGAIVAMQEGLPVATALPDGVKSEVVAAFLPQIFARLNQYAGEMKLGDVDDLLFTTHGAQCQIYRLGAVYFAVLGHPGAILPTRELRIIAGEIGRQIR
ncbi:MAG: roadblock/LC7 domain-containing protein [Chthoniobacter sp.]|nr:roadblock/LC7 domain-containing protein [Chthoniobacter sp.]